jgi:hypothetical protein
MDLNHNHSPKKTWNLQNPWKNHNRKIILSCFLITIPILAFTITTFWLVFAKSIKISSCPYPDLCYNVNTADTLRGSNYYVDLPVGRLAFVASLSSTISFMLIAACMTTYGSVAARQLLELSKLSVQGKELPSPYDITILIRLLNAEVLLLWDLCGRYFLQVIRRRSDSYKKKTTQGSRVVQKCLAILSLGLVSRSVNTTVALLAMLIVPIVFLYSLQMSIFT